MNSHVSGKKSSIIIALGLSLLVFYPLAHGADYPSKMVKLIVTGGPGSGEDAQARAIAPFLEKHLGQKIVVEDQPGVGGKIAMEKFQRTTPDGYSLLASTFPKTIIIEFMSKTSHKTTDFTPVFCWSSNSPSMFVHADTWKTLDEFLKAARTKTLSGGLSGRGSNTHLLGLLAVDKWGIKVNWVPYEGSGESLAALAGKHIDFTISSAHNAAPLVRAGKLRPMFVFGDKRDPFLPEMPSAKELGINMDTLPSMRGVWAPPKTSPVIVKVLENVFAKAVKEPGFVDMAEKTHLVLESIGSREFGKINADAYAIIGKYQQVLKQE
jgi:tripartite-type tricarboxylate transporter receptor subunit TctC